MGPSKTDATSPAKIPDLNRRDAQRQTIPVDGENGQHDSPPPYEPSSTGSTSAFANPASILTPPSSMPPTSRGQGEDEESRRSCSSFGGDDTVGLLAAGARGRRSVDEEGYRLTPRPGMQAQGREGYARADPMSVDGDHKWDHLLDKPGCCFSDTGGCCFSKRGGCCFSDREGCCCSDTRGCCFSSDEGACFSGTNPQP
ncbi:hypothetical protein EsH8_VI_001013 [Colletotrichum jinshuiense]